MNATAERFVTRETLPTKRRTWRQKVRIHDPNSGTHTFYVEFGEYADGRLGEVFVTAAKMGTFARGTLDALARSISLGLQSGASPLQSARMLIGMNYPPNGAVEAEGSTVQVCSSLADYIGQEILASYDEDGKRREVTDDSEDEVIEGAVDGPPPKEAGYSSEKWRLGV